MDRVSDALTRIKNGYMAGRKDVFLPYSKLNKAICAVLEKEGYIEKAEDVTGENKYSFKVILKYMDRKPVLSGLKRISKPGLRVYKNKSALPWVLNGMGIALISTPKGVMTDKQARKENLGGEILAFVW